MRIDATYSDGKLEFDRPIRFRHTRVRLQVEIPDAEVLPPDSETESDLDDYDSPWKEALERYFAEFLALLFPQAHAGIDWTQGYVFLDKELQKVTRKAETGRRIADKLVRVIDTAIAARWSVWRCWPTNRPTGARSASATNAGVAKSASGFPSSSCWTTGAAGPNWRRPTTRSR